MRSKTCRPFFWLCLVTFMTATLFAPTAHSASQTSLKPAVGQSIEESPPGKLLRFGVNVSAMGRLDPHFAAGSQDRALADMLFNGLLRYQPGNAPKIEPDLAQGIPEFKMTAGRQVWTIHLRRGVWFHPGPSTAAYELTADDVVFSLRKSAHRDTCAYAGEYAGMQIEKVDRYTLCISLDKPLSPILFLPKLTNYAGGFIVSKRAIENMGYDGFKAHPIGTGPFMFQGYDPETNLTLIAHQKYFRGRPKLDGVQIYFMPEIEKREAALRAGEVDVIMGHGEKGWLETIEAVPGITVDTFGVGEMATIYFNTRMTPLNDIRVRRAMAYAMSREAFLDTTSKPFVGVAFSHVPQKFLPGGLTREQAKQFGLDYGTDLKKAKGLLAEAGFPDGFCLDLVTSEKRIYRSYYGVMHDLLARIGIDCRIKVETHSNMHKTIRSDPRALVIYIAWRPNADAYLSRFFHSDSIVVTGSRPDTNFSHYDKIDKLIEAARLETDPEKQINLWIQAQIRILDDMAAFPIMYTNQGYARRTYVDYGHALISSMALYPQFTEETRLTEDKR